MPSFSSSRAAVCAALLWTVPAAQGQSIYWTKPPSHALLGADPDGAGAHIVLERRVLASPALAFDGQGGELFWSRHNSILRSASDGGDVQPLVTFIPQVAVDVAIDAQRGQAYWLAGGGGQAPRLRRVNLDGQSVQDVITAGLEAATQIAIDAHRARIYWIDAGRPAIRRASLDGSGIEDVVTLGLWQPSGIALDSAAGRMYWSDAGSGAIWSADLDGCGAQPVALLSAGNDQPQDVQVDGPSGRLYWINRRTWIQSGRTDGTDLRLVYEAPSPDRSPLAIALDLTARKLYWSEADTIRRCALDGSNVQDLFPGDPQVPSGLALDLERGKIYWRGWNISRVNLDGSNVEELVVVNPQGGVDAVGGLDLDLGAGKMYWVDQKEHKISRANLDGSEVEDVLLELDDPWDLAIDPIEGRLYWSCHDGGMILRASLDGSEIQVLIEKAAAPRGIALDASSETLYWVERQAGKIRRSGLDGRAPVDVLTGLDGPVALAVDAGADLLFWMDAGGLHRAHLDGRGVQDLGLHIGWDLVLDLRECSGHGRRIGGECACASGWSGEDCACSSAACPRGCSAAGSCVCGECACDPDFAGPDCSCRAACPGECSGHGLCTCDGCDCEPGWAGEDCACPAACPGDCSGQGECACGVCACDPGWEGPDCSCRAENCAGGCSGHGECVCGACVCAPGWGADDCSTAQVARVFLAEDGTQDQAPRTGSTLLLLNPGETAAVGVFLEDTRVPGPLLSGPRAIGPYDAIPYPGSAGAVSYVDAAPGRPGGDSIFVDEDREDWILHATTLDRSGIVYSETPAAGTFGVSYMAAPGAEVEPAARPMIHYLCEFAVRASPDARGAFILPLILPPSAPPTTALFSSFGAAYEVREYQPLTISIGAPRPLASVPPDGAIDARQPTTGRGWDRLVIWFEGPALAVDPKELQVQVSGDAALRIVEARAALDSLTIVFDQPIPAGECATIRHLPSGWSTRLGVLPGDANGDAGTGALDILALVDELSGAGSASRPWQCDINHSGVCEPSDILQLIDLLNGADGLTPWNGKSLRECP